VEAWRTYYRNHLVPAYLARLGDAGAVRGLTALYGALATRDTKLTQKSTTCPPPLMACQDMVVEAADAVAYPLWKELGLTKVSEVESAWAEVVWEADQSAGEPAACRVLLNWWDDTPQDEAYPLLAAEVEYCLKVAAGVPCPDPAGPPPRLAPVAARPRGEPCPF